MSLSLSNARGESDFRVIVGQRQLFLDDHGIAATENMKATMHQPAKKGAVIKPDRPWETALQIRCAPAWDSERGSFAVWMICSNTLTETGGGGTTYAESEDGINWAKPALNRLAIGGLAENNFIVVDPSYRWGQNCIENVVFDPDEPDVSRRYKGFLGTDGRQPIVSANGIDWVALEVPALPSQDESNLSLDRQEHTFIATLKQPGPYGRSVTLSTSNDFEHWTEPELVFHADDYDQEMAREVIKQRLADPSLVQPVLNDPEEYAADVYNMGVFRYEGLYIGLPALFHHTGRIPDGSNWDGFHHIQLTCSRGLRTWSRLGEREAFIGPSPAGREAYDTLQILPPSCPLLRGEELWFYYTGITRRHSPDGEEPGRGAICLAVLRRDGFVSLDAGAREGWVLSKPFLLPVGDLHLNANAAGGQILVQIADEEGSAIPGFEASEPIRGDHLDTVVHWPNARSGSLAGRRVRLRMTLRSAELYSYWVE